MNAIAKMRGQETPQQPPPISERTALLSGLLFTILYVAPFYISPTLRTSSLNSRDSPIVIKARVRAVLLSCLASTLITIFLHAILAGHDGSSTSPGKILRLFGMYPIHLEDIFSILLLLGVLFAAPLYELLIIDSSHKNLSWKSLSSTFWTSPTSHRNLVIAPWCEELVFRSLVISLYLLTPASPARIIFTSPLIFGVAHIHHFVENISSRTPSGQRFPAGKVVVMVGLISCFQLLYTSLFGFFAAFVFLRTGNVFVAIAAHTFCNFMGLPRVWGRLGPVEMVEVEGVESITPDVAQGRVPPVAAGTDSRQQQQRRKYQERYTLGMGWTVGYYVLLVGGAWGFYKLLWTLTESGNALVTF